MGPCGQSLSSGKEPSLSIVPRILSLLQEGTAGYSVVFLAPLPLSIGLLVLVPCWRCWRNPSALTHAKVASRPANKNPSQWRLQSLTGHTKPVAPLRGNFSWKVQTAHGFACSLRSQGCQELVPSGSHVDITPKAEGTLCLGVKVTQGCSPVVFLSEWGK